MGAGEQVLVTGLGIITAVGIGREDFLSGLTQGREGRRPPERLRGDWTHLPRLAECLDFAVEDYLESEKTYLDRCSELTLAACALALNDAGLDHRALNAPRFGLSLGTAFGCLDSMTSVTARVQAKGVRFASPVIFTHSFANSPASLAAIEYGMQGPVCTFCCGDVSSAAALQYGLNLVRWGRAEVVLAGGVDALSVPLLAALDAAGGLPNGDAPGEGACLLVLEGESRARQRGAMVLGELVEVMLGGADEVMQSAQADPPTLPRWEGMGNTFGASVAVDTAVALLSLAAGCEREAYRVSRADPAGRGATVTVRRVL